MRSFPIREVHMSWLRKHVSPGLALLLIAPLLGELLSGHQKPLEFINPVTFLLMALPYGFGALICRELSVRWGKGKLSLLLLAAAYGLYEEAVVIKSVFNAGWSELGPIGPYNYWGGINWTYGLMLIHFHIAVSIVSSVLIAESIYPDRAGARWLSDKQLILTGIGLALWIPFGAWAMPGIPSIPLYIIAILCMGALVYAARRTPARPLKKTGRPVKKPWLFMVLGFLDTAAILLGTFYEGPKPPLWVSVLVLALIDIVAFMLVLRWSDNGYGWTRVHKAALALGIVLFFLIAAALQDFDEGFAGRSVVSIISLIVLSRWYRRVRREERGEIAGPA